MQIKSMTEFENLNMSSEEGGKHLIRCTRQIKPPMSVFSGHDSIFTGMV